MVLEKQLPLILGVETATETRGVVLMRGAQIIGAITSTAAQNTNSLLLEVDRLLITAQVRLRDVELLAAATGPGSFMGLRTGLAMLKAFASSLKLPAFGVPTLHAVAYATGSVGRVLAVIPAGRGEVFAQALSLSKQKSIEELSAPIHTTLELLLEAEVKTRSSLLWAGEGAHRHRGLIQARAAQAGWHWQAGDDAGPSVAHEVEASAKGITWALAAPHAGYAPQVAMLALKAWEKQHLGQTDALRALYVRQSDAELKE